MAEQRSLYLGPRIKRLRRELGLTQQAMADDLDISPSYIALLERNQRPITADLLLRLARTYRLDVGALADEDAEHYARRVADVLRDPLFADIDLPALEVADLATSFPGISEALLRLHGAYQREQSALAEMGAGGGGLENDPVGEARRFLAERRNFFPTLEARAEAIGEAIEQAGGQIEWLGAAGIRVRYLPPEVLVDSVARFDRHNQQLMIDDTLDMATRTFQIALQIAYRAMRTDISAILRGQSFSSQAAGLLVRRALAGYAAAALLMPYDKFARATEDRRYDIEVLARLFTASFEQIAHRLTTLNRPGGGHVPFFFIRVDQAGNVSKRLDGAGFPFAAHGGGCPLWNLHDAFRTPGEILTQWLELTDGQRFFSIARTVSAGGGGHARARVTRSVALACAAEHAPRLVYAAGINPRDVVVTPIGVNCRLCQREACTARALPPIGREIIADDFRRAARPFAFEN